jgi:hypothetical protein
MQVRVGLLGGQFDARPLAGGGFRVQARLPLRDPAGEPPRPSADGLAATPSGSPAPGQAGQ